MVAGNRKSAGSTERGSVPLQEIGESASRSALTPMASTSFINARFVHGRSTCFFPPLPSVPVHLDCLIYKLKVRPRLHQNPYLICRVSGAPAGTLLRFRASL